jgi:uncharacterized membrane protein YdfJ with MMPL/SSD domain
MERLFGQFMPRARVLAVASLGGTVLLAGCGADNSYKNKLRPSEPINVTANVSDKRVSVSPTGFGAGPIVLIITNQTARDQDVTLETRALNEKAGIKQSTGAIVPQGGTAQLQVDMIAGNYRLSAADDTIAPAKIAVGNPRGSSQNELLQP